MIKSNFFVLKMLSNLVILGNPFFADSRAEIEYDTYRKIYITVHNEDNQTSSKFVALRRDLSNPAGTIRRMGKGQGAITNPLS